MAEKEAFNKLNGIVSKTAKRKGIKAVHTRIVNLFKVGRVKRGQKMLDNLKKRSLSRWEYVNKLIKKSCS